MASASAIDIELKGLQELVESLGKLGREQIPFAMSKALNATANNCRDQLRAELDKQFTIRDEWTAKGVRTGKVSTKTRLEAQVGSKEEYMARQAKGGTKRARGGKSLGIPLVGGARPTLQDRVMREKWPSRLLEGYIPPTPGMAYPRPGAGKRVFIAPIKGGPQPGVFQRKMRASWRGGERTPIRLMYAFRSVIKVPKGRWTLDPTVRATVKAMWRINAYAALIEALKTAKPNPIPYEVS